MTEAIYLEVSEKTEAAKKALNILMYSAERSERLRPKICINFLTARETPLYFAQI